MGLDVLDLVFHLEKRFGIEISNEEGFAVLFHTAGNIHRYLVAKLQGEYKETPRIEPLFVEISQAVSRIRGRWKLYSTTDLNKCFPGKNRASNWEDLGMG